MILYLIKRLSCRVLVFGISGEGNIILFCSKIKRLRQTPFCYTAGIERRALYLLNAVTIKHKKTLNRVSNQSLQLKM